MTALAFASGVACAFTYALEPLWRELSVGLIFGVVVAAWLYRLRLATPAKAAGFVPVSLVAWMIAERTAIELFDRLPGETSNFLSVNGLMTGIAAGLVGSGLLFAGAALLLPCFRDRGAALATVGAGGVLGALLTLIDVTDSALVLFPPWQAGVAFCLALALPRPGATSP